MKKLSIKWTSLLLVWLLLLTGCLATTIQNTGTGSHRAKVSDGIGGSGQRVAEGIGGTGQKVANGIGGTGQKVADGIGGTGIIGTITGFGSIWINSAHVHFDNAAITNNRQLAGDSSFRLGQVVAALSDPIKDGYQARSIDIVHEVVGPVTSIDRKRHTLTVLSQTVAFDRDTIFSLTDGKSTTSASLKIAQFVKISGLRQVNDTIIASRIDLINTQKEVQLIGRLSHGKLSGQPLIIDKQLEFDANAERLLVTGKLINGIIIVEQIGKDSILQIVEQASDLLLEGFLFDDAFDGDIIVGGIELVLPEGFEFDWQFDPDEPLFIDAELGDDDLFYTEDILDFPEGAEDFFGYDPDEFINEGF